jgi:polar amino acid transport system substrate-binding protein
MSMLRSGTRTCIAGAAVASLALVGAACGSTKATTAPTTVSPASAPTTVAGLGVPAKYLASGLNVAMDASYPPDEFVQSGKSVGFDVDLINAIGSALGVKVTVTNATFNTIITGIVDGKFNVGDSSFTDNKTREKQVDFVDYFVAGEGYYVKATSTKTFNGLAALCGHSVAVESGTTEESDAKTQAKTCHVNVLSFSDQNQANLAVSSGRADVGFLDSQVASYVVHISNGQFKVTGTPFSTAPYGLAFAKNSGLAQPVLAALQKLIANGTYMQILSKWGVQQGAVTTPKLNGATS